MTDPNALVGRTLGGKLLLVGILGEGGMGTVYRAVHQLVPQPDVAVKVLHQSFADDPTYRARFEREVRTSAQIDHPNAVAFLEEGIEDGVPYFVMELVEGRELFDVLAVERRLPEARAATIALQICDAVATAHDRGIIHRDLKPENVMLVGDPASPQGERVKLLDFGIAKHVGLDGDDANRITVMGSIVGTPTYMAPEQGQGNPVDARSDVYACGAVLYHLVTGRPPFEDECPIQTLYRHVHEAPVPPGVLVPDLSPELSAIILKALAKRPEDRHQGADELWEELLAILPSLWAKSGLHPVAPPPAPVALHHRAPTWALPPVRVTPVPPVEEAVVYPRRARRPPPQRHRVPLFVGLAAAAGIAAAIVGWAAIPASSANGAVSSSVHSMSLAH
jgi:serine/threonine protein kinase